MLEDELSRARGRASARHQAAAWLEAAQVLQQRLAVAERDVATALQCVPAAALEAQQLATHRLQHRAQLTANLETVRRAPHRWLPTFSASLTSSLSTLATQLEQLGDVVGDAQRCIVACTTRGVGERLGGAAAHHSAAPATTPAASVSALQQHDARPPAVAACDAFVASHAGPSLGWSDADHQVFLAAVAHFAGNREELVADLTARLGHPPAEVVRHLELHRRLAELHREKRLAIEAFREQRRADEENVRALAALRQHRDEQASRRVELDKERRAVERQQLLARQVAEFRVRRQKEQEAARKATTAQYALAVQRREAEWRQRRAALKPALDGFARARAADRARAALEKREANALPKPLRAPSKAEMERRWRSAEARAIERREQTRKRDVRTAVEAKQQRQLSYLDACRDVGLVRSPSSPIVGERGGGLVQDTAASAARRQAGSPTGQARTPRAVSCDSRGPLHLQPSPTPHFSRSVASWCGRGHQLL